MNREQISEIASDIYFYFIDEITEHQILYDDFIIHYEDHSENTDRGSELFYLIEDKLMEKFGTDS